MSKQKTDKTPEPKKQPSQNDKLLSVEAAHEEGVWRGIESKRQQTEARIT
jgi:hypothetical protein